VWTENLFEPVLVDPVRAGADKLCIVSGYANPAMVSQHLHYLTEKLRQQITMELIVGMTPVDGLERRSHLGFQTLTENNALGHFMCSYVMMDRSPVHSKVYLWMHRGQVIQAYTGSANYTQNAFLGRQREVLVECDPASARDYYNAIVKDTVFCTHGEVENYVRLTVADRERRASEHRDPRLPKESRGLDCVTCPLLKNRDGEIHTAAGLNWGQREGRNPNQAYIPVPANVSRIQFFPERGAHFTVSTDDGKVLICRRAQDNGKAIETPANNGLLGEYFRNRLGLANGAYITKQDLERYGRTDVTFYKIDDENYHMDFSV